MKTMTVGEFKAQLISAVKNGEEIAVTFGRKKEVIGYFKPNVLSGKPERKVGLFDKAGGYFMADDFCETSEEEFPLNDSAL